MYVIVFLYGHACVHVRVCLRVCACACMCACMRARVCMCVCMCMYVCMLACVRVQMTLTRAVHSAIMCRIVGTTTTPTKRKMLLYSVGHHVHVCTVVHLLSNCLVVLNHSDI